MSWSLGLQVTGDGKRVVAHAGVAPGAAAGTTRGPGRVRAKAPHYRLLHVPAQLTRSARRRALRLPIGRPIAPLSGGSTGSIRAQITSSSSLSRLAPAASRGNAHEQERHALETGLDAR